MWGRLTGFGINRAEALGIRGTDLGVAFPWGDRLAFLFGDTVTTDPGDPGSGRDDCFAFTDRRRPFADGAPGLPRLNWITAPSGRFAPLVVPGVSLGTMEVPVEGIFLQDRVYLFFDSDWEPEAGRHKLSVLAHGVAASSRPTLILDHAAPSDRFINLSAVKAPQDYDEAPRILLFGSGPFRKSAVYLARVDPDDLPHRDRWRYFRGIGSNGPEYGPDEASAAPLFEADCVGELSAAFHEVLGRWLLVYCTSPPNVQVHLRTAPRPEGPWSAPLPLFRPRADGGYGTFIHARRNAVGYDDGLSDPGREETWGGPYGAYLVPEWFRTEAPGRHVLVYTLSSWNPYQVHLMETELIEPGAEPGARPDPVEAVERKPDPKNLDFRDESLEGWSQEGDVFHVEVRPDGSRFLSTSTPDLGEAAQGRMGRDILVTNDMEALVFIVRGGHGSVQLFRGEDRIYRTFGPNRPGMEIPVRWNLRPFRGRQVRLIIEDRHFDPGGFIAVGPIRLIRK